MTPTPEQNAKRETPRTDEAWNHSCDLEEHERDVFLAEFAGRLETELRQKQTIIENHCKDWAEDDTAIKELCKRCGVADVHPVGDDFKSCVECVEELAHKFTELRQAADGMAKALDEHQVFAILHAESWRANPAYGNGQPSIHPTHQGIIDRAKDSLARYRALAGEGK